MDYEQAKAIFLQSGKAMLDFLERYSVGIVIFDKDENPQEIGSGTCITVGGRYFIATAAHVISKEEVHRGRWSVVGKDSVSGLHISQNEVPTRGWTCL